MHKTVLYSALLVIFTLPAQAASLDAHYLSVAGGMFAVDDEANNYYVDAGNWTNVQNPGANLIDGYVALGEVSFFFGSAMSLYTGDGSFSPYGGLMTPSGGPVPTAILDDEAHTISVDLSAFTWYWNGINFSQGNSSVTGTWNPLSGAYSVAWESPYALGYGFDGLVGQWTMTGIAVAALPVPEPAAYAMMLAGLAMVGGMVLRRRATVASR